MSDSEERIKQLEDRVARLERQMALAMRRGADNSRPARDARASLDHLDYPER